MKNRLQIKYHMPDTFPYTREAAQEYLKNYADPMQGGTDRTLVSEPLVIFYGEENKLNAILGIGTGGDGQNFLKDKPYFTIDTAKIEEDLEKISKDIEDIEKISQIVDAVKKLEEKFNELNTTVEEQKSRIDKGEKILQTHDKALLEHRNTLDGHEKTIGANVENIRNLLSAVILDENGDFELKSTDVEYLDGVETVNEALKTLDNELFKASSNLKNETKKIDNIIKGAGLEPDGSYKRDDKTAFIKDALSLKDADKKLDAILYEEVNRSKDEDDAFELKIETLTGNLAKERERATVEEVKLSKRIDTNSTLIEKHRVVSEDKTILINKDGKDENKNLSVNIDGSTIIKKEDGKIGVEPSILLAYSSEAPIQISGRTISLVTNPDDLVLVKEATGLKCDITLDWPEGEDFIYLKGKGGAEISKVPVAKFLKDGMLNKVDFNEETKELTFTFNILANDKPSHESITVNLASLIDTYDAGNGIEKVIDPNSNPRFEGKVKSGTVDKFLRVDKDGFYTEGITSAIDNVEKISSGNKADIAIINGGKTVEGSILYAVEEESVRAKAEEAENLNKITENEVAINSLNTAKDNHENRIVNNEDSIKKLNSDATVQGSVKHTIFDSVIGTSVTQIDPTQARNQTLIRIITNDPKEKTIYVSNDTNDMVYNGKNLSGVIDELLAEINNLKKQIGDLNTELIDLKANAITSIDGTPNQIAVTGLTQVPEYGKKATVGFDKNAQFIAE